MTEITAIHGTAAEVVDAFIDLVKTRPFEFQISEHTVTHTPSGIAFWTGNGRAFAKLYRPSAMPLGWWQQLRFWHWHRRLAFYQAQVKLRVRQPS